jgi:hypothetical protein
MYLLLNLQMYKVKNMVLNQNQLHQFSKLLWDLN